MKTVMVPVHLDALHLKVPTKVFSNTLPYSHLPHFRNGRAYNSDVPYVAEALQRDAFLVADAVLAPGVHLHWSMPDALTRAGHDDSMPALPNRWAVHRTGGGLIERSWLVLSDAVRHGPKPLGLDMSSAC